MKKFDASIPRKMFWSTDVGGTDFCPQCQGRLQNESHSYLLMIREGGEIQPFIAGNDSGYFCPHCPVVVLKYEEFAQLASMAMSEGYRGKFTVMGIVDLDAVPEEKLDVPLGDDDNPIPLVKFTNLSDPVLGRRRRMRGKLKTRRKRKHSRNARRSRKKQKQK